MANKAKQVLMRRIWKIPVYLLLALAGASIVTAAVMYTLRIPSTVTILPSEGAYQIGIYEDEACTTEVTSFDFGEVSIPGSSSAHFYVKSFSTVPTSVGVSIEPYVAGLNYIVWIVHPDNPLQPDEVREAVFELLVDVGASQGTYDFDVVLKVYPA